MPYKLQSAESYHVEMFYRILSRKLPRLTHSFYYFVHFSKGVSASAVFIFSRCEQTALCLSLLKESLELSSEMTIRQDFIFSLRGSGGGNPVPAHVPSGEGGAVASAFQERLKHVVSAPSQDPDGLEM